VTQKIIFNEPIIFKSNNKPADITKHTARPNLWGEGTSLEHTLQLIYATKDHTLPTHPTFLDHKGKSPGCLFIYLVHLTKECV